MIKQILKKLNAVEQKKEKKLKDQADLQKEIDDLDTKLKKYHTFKKDYEKLQKNFDDFINSEQEK